MNTTPNVFIMSSSHGLALAKALASVLGRGKRMDVKTWSDPGQFRTGDSFIDTLRRTTIQYDFGICVMTPDDATVVRNERVREPRDNVLFEFGLFMGARGIRRAFPLVVQVGRKKAAIPSDMKGVSHLTLKLDRLKGLSAYELRPQVEALGRELADRMLDLYEQPEITILPSTGLAIGYFHNFILPVFGSLVEKRYVDLHASGGKSKRRINVDVHQARMVICIPSDLKDATKESWAAKCRSLRLGTAEVDPPAKYPRAYPFRIQPARRGQALTIYDSPTTLLAARHSVNRLLKGTGATTRDVEQAEEKEVHNFRKTIEALLRDPDNDSFSRQVSFTSWDDLS